MKIIKTEVVEIDGIKYQIDTYDTGTTVRTLWTDPDAPRPEPEPEPEPAITDREMLEAIALNMEYLTALNEIEEGMI